MSIPKFWVKWLEDFYEKTKNSIFINTCSEKVAVLIEPRQHPLIKLVVHNFMYFLAPKGWSLLVVCGTDNSDFVDNELYGLNINPSSVLIISSSRVILTSVIYISIVDDFI